MEGVTFRAGLKLETGCWLWRLHWFWSQLRDADGQITFSKGGQKTRRDQNAVFGHRGRKIIAKNCTQGYCKLLTTLTACSYIQQSFTVTSRSLWLPDVLATTAAIDVAVVMSPWWRHPAITMFSRGAKRWTRQTTVYSPPLSFCNASGDFAVSKLALATPPIVDETRGGDPPPPSQPLTFRHSHPEQLQQFPPLKRSGFTLFRLLFLHSYKIKKFTLATTSQHQDLQKRKKNQKPKKIHVSERPKRSWKESQTFPTGGALPRPTIATFRRFGRPTGPEGGWGHVAVTSSYSGFPLKKDRR